MKRTICILLALSLLFCCFPLFAAAEGTEKPETKNPSRDNLFAMCEKDGAGNMYGFYGWSSFGAAQAYYGYCWTYSSCYKVFNGHVYNYNYSFSDGTKMYFGVIG